VPSSRCAPVYSQPLNSACLPSRKENEVFVEPLAPTFCLLHLLAHGFFLTIFSCHLKRNHLCQLCPSFLHCLSSELVSTNACTVSVAPRLPPSFGFLPASHLWQHRGSLAFGIHRPFLFLHPSQDPKQLLSSDFLIMFYQLCDLRQII
jgi:hypothetical protein